MFVPQIELTERILTSHQVEVKVIPERLFVPLATAVMAQMNTLHNVCPAQVIQDSPDTWHLANVPIASELKTSEPNEIHSSTSVFFLPRTNYTKRCPGDYNTSPIIVLTPLSRTSFWFCQS